MCMEFRIYSKTIQEKLPNNCYFDALIISRFPGGP